MEHLRDTATKGDLYIIIITLHKNSCLRGFHPQWKSIIDMSKNKLRVKSSKKFLWYVKKLQIAFHTLKAFRFMYY